jgi:protein O-GlcNAc transferase
VSTEQTVTLGLPGGVRVVVPDSLDLITPYVLREQEDWFEDELAFVRVLLGPGEKTIDIGANYGVYALTLANAVGPSGHVWAFEPASETARLLAAGIAANAYVNVTLEQCALSREPGSAQLALHSHSELNALVRDGAAAGAAETVRVDTLDARMAAYGAPRVDFIKIDAEGEEAAIIAGGARFFAERSPLVQYEIKSGTQADTALVEVFAAVGYRSYRLVPGLCVLVPFDASSAPDAFLLNVFCCKPDRAARLAAQGRLAEGTEHVTPAAAHDWRQTIAKLPYGQALEEKWAQTVAQGRSADIETALAFHAMSRDPSRSAGERVFALGESVRLFSELRDDEPSAPRLASLARVAAEHGSRRFAVTVLGELYGMISGTDAPDLAEPFLAPCARFDTIATAGSPARWLLAAVLEAIEKLSAYSSFYSGAGARGRLEAIERLGYGSAEMARRLQLVNARFRA